MTSSRLWLLAPLALMVSLPVAPLAHAADPTIQQVYGAAAAGQMDKAQDMMQQVLKDHPQSAKAHYVEAELLARQHRYDEARGELAKAESLAPGLSFARPQAVSALKRQLSGGTAAMSGAVAPVAVQQESRGFPWWPVIVVGGLLFAVLAFFRRRGSASVYPPMAGTGGYNPNGYGPGSGPMGGPGYGAGYGQGGGMMGPGMGSGIMGGLAQGAAMGAGFAAGERVIDGLFGGHDRERIVERDVPVQQGWDSGSVNQDMGGDDFGISDDSSWDDSGNGGW